MSALELIASLLRRTDGVTLPDNWQGLTPADLHLDSLDLIELQLELESTFAVELSENVVAGGPLTHVTFAALAERIENLRKQGGAV